MTVRKTIDTLIATRCIESGYDLLHSDADFQPFVKHLGLRAWWTEPLAEEQITPRRLATYRPLFHQIRDSARRTKAGQVMLLEIH